MKLKEENDLNSMYRLLILSFFISFFVACSSNEESTPAGVLDKEKMTMVLAEIYIIDAATNIQNFSNGLTLPANPSPLYDKFLKKENVTYQEFRSSYEYYLQHPKELSEIYTSLMDELSRRQAIQSKR